jgi:mannose-6-phosphate isomerase-like protein (cupin superfamily)
MFMATPSYPYEIHLNNLNGPLELIDEKALSDSVKPWFNQTLCRVNDAVVRVAVVEGDYHWHKHDADDEFFYVVEGELLIDHCAAPGEDPANGHTTIELKPRQGVVIPKGVMHRPRSPLRTVILMVETHAIVPTGS